MNLKHRLNRTTLAIANGHIRRHPIMHRNLFHPNGHRPGERYDLKIALHLRDRCLLKLHRQDILEEIADLILHHHGFDLQNEPIVLESSFNADLPDDFDEDLDYDLDGDDQIEVVNWLFDEDIICVSDEAPDECPHCGSLLDANFCRECGYDASAKADMGECALLQQREISHLHARARR